MRILFLYNRFESMGIEVLSSYLKSKGHETYLLFDPQLFNDVYLNIPFLAKKYDYKEKIIKEFEKINPDIIAFSVITDNYLWALNMAKHIRSKSQAPIVFGGIHCTSVPEEVISQEDIDYVIVGEGEYALLELVNALEKGGNVSEINNLVFRNGDKIIKNELNDLIQDLDSLLPDKELFYKKMPFARNNYSVMSSRGCPFSCTYCFNHMYRNLYSGKGKYIRKRSVDNVIKELRTMKEKSNFNFVSILDDVFMVDDNWVSDFSEKYIKYINVPFRCNGHVNFVNENNIKALKNAGCELIQVGVQTTCENTRKNIIHRYETNEVIKKAAKIIKKYKIRLEIDHMLGLPKEGEKEQIEAANFYNEIRPDTLNCYWLKCFPNTDIIPHMIADNKLTEEDIGKMEKGLSPSYIRGGSVKEVKTLKKYASLFNLIPVMPKILIKFIIKNKLYYLTNFGNNFMIFLRAIKGIFWRDIRLSTVLSFYRYYILKR